MRHSHKIFGAVLILALASLLVVLPSDMARPASQFDLRSASGRWCPTSPSRSFLPRSFSLANP